MQPKNLFLEGAKGAGKTTILLDGLEDLKGCAVGGFIVKKVGFEGALSSMVMVDLMTGSKETLLTFGERGEREVFYSCFNKIGVPSILRALEKADLVVMDELGRFELCVPIFLDAVNLALDSRRPVVGILKEESNPFLDAIRRRDDVHTIYVEEKSRKQSAGYFTASLKTLLS